MDNKLYPSINNRMEETQVTEFILALLTPTKWMVKMNRYVWLITVTSLWNIFWLNVEILLKLDRYVAEDLQQLIHEVSISYVFNFLSGIGLFYEYR